MNYITPEEAVELCHKNDPRTLKDLREVAKSDTRCDVCDRPIWRFGHGDKTGLCFTCTTGEADDNDDYELLPIKT